MTNFEKYGVERVESGLEPFLEDFLAERKREALVLESYYSDKDYTAMCKIIHSWKGYCAPYGFGHLGALAQEMEPFLKTQDHTKSGEYLAQIQTYLKNKNIMSLMGNV